MAEEASAEDPEKDEEEKDALDPRDEEDENEEEGEGVADGEAEEGAGKAKLKMILMIVLLVVVGIGVGSGGVYFLLNSPKGEDVAEEETADESKEEKSDEDKEPEMPATPYYFSLDPAFVVNFTGKSRAKFLQVNIDGMTREAQVKEDITTHLPQIRSAIILLLSSKTYEDLNTPDGKEDLRKEILSVIKKILRKETGVNNIEDVYFTSFVMQ